MPVPEAARVARAAFFSVWVQRAFAVQAGAGSSWTRKPGEAVVQEGVLAGSLRYQWKINEHAALTERINVEARSRNTQTAAAKVAREQPQTR